MTLVQIDPGAADGFAATIADTASQVRATVAALAEEVSSLPPDAVAGSGADSVLSGTDRVVGRFAAEAGELRDLLTLAAVLARRADYAAGTTEIDDGVLFHRALGIGGGAPDMTPPISRFVCATADAVGWVDYAEDGAGPGTATSIGKTVANGAQSLLGGLLGRGGPAGAVFGSVASVGQLLCADTGYRGRDTPREPKAPERGDPSWRDPAGGDGREDRHGNPPGSTGNQMPDSFLGAPPG